MLALIIPLSELGGGIPGQGLPIPPVYPGHGLPGGQPLPGHDLPGGPPPTAGQLPVLPPSVWPPVAGGPSNPIVLPPAAGNLPVYPIKPDQGLPDIPPGVVWPPLPPSAGSGKAIALVAISGVGYRWTIIDTSLTVGFPMPGPK